MSWKTFLHKARLQTNIAPELIRRGWNLYDYREPTREEEGFMTHDCLWTGIATHPDNPKRVLAICVSPAYADRSGQPAFEIRRNQQFSGHEVIPMVIPIFPHFQPNPKGKTWHIQSGDLIVVKGTIPQICADKNETLRREPIAKLVDVFESYCLGRVTISR